MSTSNFKLAMENAILQIAKRAIEAGSYTQLTEIGFTWDDIRCIRKLPVSLLDSRNSSGGDIISLDLNHSNLTGLMQNFSNHEERQGLLDRMILAGATYELVSDYFSLNKNRFSDRRKLLDVQKKGRRKEDTRIGKRDEEIWINYYIEYMSIQSPKDAARLETRCEAYLYISDLTGVDINKVSSVIKKAKINGEIRRPF